MFGNRKYYDIIVCWIIVCIYFEILNLWCSFLNDKGKDYVKVLNELSYYLLFNYILLFNKFK